MTASRRMGPASRPVMAEVDPRDKPRPGDIVRSPLGHGRETVESIVVAFTIALLFRAFEAELFVIPTGSMAPTLMGRHKDLVCESCGRPHQLSASSEEHGTKPRQARCPNCGFVTRLLIPGDGPPRYDPRFPSFNGDRILVSKIAYDLEPPERWDVTVFKYPEDAKTNYIKRLVGLPGETVFIRDGDIWVSRGGDRPEIARKPPEKLLAMLQCVYDSRYESAAMRKAGWPTCFADWSAERGGGPAWSTRDDGRSFEVDSAGDASAMLRYRHFLPTPSDWERIAKGQKPGEEATPTLIDDFQPYNPEATKPHWVGDLAIEFDLESRAAAGDFAGDSAREIVIDLVEAGIPHRCRIDLSTGEATLDLPGGTAEGPPRARTAVRGRGRWRLLFANVDDELSLFVDGRPVGFDRPARYGRGDGPATPDTAPQEPGVSKPGDLAPVGLAVRGGSVRVERLRVLRDVYYVKASDLAPGAGRQAAVSGYPLEEGQFFMLGDNSSASMDSRLWRRSHHVDRDLLIGKAVAILWPHAIPAKWAVSVPLGRSDVRLPFWPNFARMKFIR